MWSISRSGAQWHKHFWIHRLDSNMLAVLMICLSCSLFFSWYISLSVIPTVYSRSDDQYVQSERQSGAEHKEASDSSSRGGVCVTLPGEGSPAACRGLLPAPPSLYLSHPTQACLSLAISVRYKPNLSPLFPKFKYALLVIKYTMLHNNVAKTVVTKAGKYTQ